MRTGRAALLGALHGPAELLPVSSSAHVTLVPRLLGWGHEALAPDVHKAFEVALHAGTLGALVALVPRPPAAFLALSTLPPAVAGLVLERPIEARLGGTRGVAAGLIAGSAALVAANAIGSSARTDPNTATGRDALALGAAQALALVPGTSRLGLAVAAARLRGFDRRAAFALARGAGLPVIAGATVLKSVRLARRGLAPELRAPFAAGAAAALAGTIAAAPLARSTAIAAPAAERVLLAALALRRAR